MHPTSLFRVHIFVMRIPVKESISRVRKGPQECYATSTTIHACNGTHRSCACGSVAKPHTGVLGLQLGTRPRAANKHGNKSTSRDDASEGFMASVRFLSARRPSSALRHTFFHQVAVPVGGDWRRIEASL